MSRFVGRTALVTGASGLLGRAIATGLAGQGAAVVAADLPGSQTQAVVDEISAVGGKALAVELDVSRADQMAAAVASAVDHFGGLSIMVNNAGIVGGFANVDDFDDDVFDKTFAVNVRGVYLGMKYAVPQLKAGGGGAIVNIASVAGLQGTPGMIAYGMSKHAVIGMTKTVAAEQAAFGIRATAVCPAPVEGRMMRSIENGVSTDAGGGESVRDAYRAAIPAGRYAEAGEIAQLVSFLASDEASYITGSWHRIDGGLGVMSA